MSIPKISPYTLPGSLPQCRTEWRLEPSRMAVLVHDLQDHFLDYFERSGEPLRSVLANIQTLLSAARSRDIPVLYSAQPPDQSLTERGLLNDMWGPGITANPSRAAIAREVKPAPHDTVLRKYRYSAFRSTDLQEILQREARDQLVIVGVYAHIGCLASALDAFMLDIKPILVADAIADFSAQYHEQALSVAANCSSLVVHSSALVQVLEASPRAPSLGSPKGLTYEALQAELATLLELPEAELHGDTSLLDLGLDSIRIMELVERFRLWGVETSFMDLAEEPTLGAYWRRLSAPRTTHDISPGLGLREALSR